MKTGNDRTPETVTIVMPVYNPGKYLASCLDSLLAQTFGDFRLIAIDDGSTDGSGEVLRAYAEKDSRILAWKNPENLGAARTRNIGMQMAKGKYLSFLDADDLYGQEYLSTLVDAMERYDVDIAECDYYELDARTGDKIPHQVPETWRKRMLQPVAPEEIADILFLTTHFAAWAFMYRRAFLMEHMMQFQDISSYNDNFFVKMSLMLASRMIHIDRALFCYRIHTGHQISSRRFRKSAFNFFLAYDLMRRQMERRGVSQKYRQSYHDVVIQVSLSVLWMLAPEQWQEGREAFRKWFAVLRMTELSRKDFHSEVFYHRWKMMVQKDFDVTHEDAEDADDKAFFQEMAVFRDSVALWGYGKLGKRFLQLAERARFPIKEIYDRDDMKWDETHWPPIKPFFRHDKNIKAVIVTNAAFFAEICEEIQQESADLRGSA